MARSYAKLLTSIWSDDDFRALTAAAQRTYMLLISQPTISNVGVLPLTPKRWARLATDTDQGTIGDAIDELVARRFVLIDDDTEEVLVRTFIRHDGGMKIPNVRKSMVSDLGNIASPMLLGEAVTVFCREHVTVLGKPAEPFPEQLTERLPEGMGYSSTCSQHQHQHQQPAAAPPSEPSAQPQADTEPATTPPPLPLLDQDTLDHVEDCCALYAAWRYDHEKADVRSPTRWKTRVADDTRTEHGTQFAHHLLAHPDATPADTLHAILGVSEFELRRTARQAGIA